MSTNLGYHRIIRKMVIAFGNVFNNINLSRYDSNGDEVETFLVPILYGGKEKYVSRMEGDPNLDKKVQITLPVMSFEMTDMSYDATRKLNTNQKTLGNNGTQNTTYATYSPVPFDFDFSLVAYVRNIEDGAQLMEKILPHFTPDYTLNVNLIPEMGIIKQIPIILKSVSHEIDYEGDGTTNVRKVMWTLNFTVKGYLYGATQQPKIVRRSITNLISDTDMNKSSIIATLNSGLGDYLVGETVYQGYSHESATATAIVKYWDPVNKKLEIENVLGHFVSSSPMRGLSTNATWTVVEFNFSTKTLVRTEVMPKPRNVVLPNNYTYVVRTTENPSAEIGPDLTIDAINIDLSETDISMDNG